MLHDSTPARRFARFPRLHRVLLVALITVGCGEAPSGPGMAQAQLATVRQPVADTAQRIDVDFAAPLAVRSASGFLHGTIGDAVHDSLVRVLRPTLWRVGSFEKYARVAGTGARVEMVLSDLWGYPRVLADGARRWPYEDWALWEQFVDSVARMHSREPVRWDVWNEPDIPYFWPQDQLAQQRFHEAYARAYRVLRGVLGPGAEIGGPSFSQYFPERMDAFLNYCVAAGCEVNFLAWHELGPDLPGITRHLDDARVRYLQAPAYAALAMRELHVNETTSEQNRDLPGAVVGTLFHLERGRVDAAARSCWPGADHVLTCYNGSLDGLLTPAFQPRATWWAYKAYAVGVGSRVRTSDDANGVVALASRSAEPVGTFAGAAQVLVGYHLPYGGPDTARVVVHLANVSAVPGVAGRRDVRVRVLRIPSTGEQAVPTLAIVDERRLRVSRDAVELRLTLKMHEAYVIVLRP